MLRWTVVPRTLERLKNKDTPKAIEGETPMESVPWSLYGTLNMVSGTTRNLTFFTGLDNANLGLGNFGSGGGLPDPQYFEVQYVTIDYLIPPSATAWADWFQVAVANSGRFSMTLQSKPYSEARLQAVGGSGGMTGYGNIAAADPALFYAHSGAPGMAPLYVGGAVIIAPKGQFSANIEWQAAPVTTLDPVPTVVTLFGTLYRAIR